MYQNGLDKACCQHDMARGYCLPGITAPDIVLRDKAFNIVKSSKYDGYHRSLAAIFYKFC